MSTTRCASRRTFIKSMAGMGLVLSQGWRPAHSKELKKVTMVIGGAAPGSPSSSFVHSLGIGCGFYAEEGLEVEMQWAAGASAALTLLASGRAQFASHSTGALLPAVARGVPVKGFIVQIPDNFVSIGVLKEGPIKSLADLKGKTIGVNADGGGPTLLVKAVLNQLGWKVGTDVELLTVGAGLPALDALRRDRVQAVGLWDEAYGLFEFNGTPLTYFNPEPLPRMGFAHTTNTMQSTIDKEPETVAAMGRALAKALVFFAAAKPEDVFKVHYKVFPSAKPGNLSDADNTRLEMLRLQKRMASLRLKQRVFDRTEKIGDDTDEKMASFAKLMYDGKETPVLLKQDQFFTRQFLPTINSIDIKAGIDKARNFKA